VEKKTQRENRYVFLLIIHGIISTYYSLLPTLGITIYKILFSVIFKLTAWHEVNVLS